MSDYNKNNIQEGGKYLGEGADGCIFEAPDNWPCEKPLKGYNSSDKSLVSKIVPKEDIEGNILNIIKSIAKRHPEHYNLIRFIGQCKPKISDFNKTQKKVFNKHINQTVTTSKACKVFRKDLINGKHIKNDDYKMYIIGKYNSTYKGFCQKIEFSFLSKDKVADIIYDAHFAFIETLDNLINDPIYTVINFDLHSKNIVVYTPPNIKYESSKTIPKKFEIGIADFGRSVWRKKTEKQYDFETFIHWDQPYIDSFLVRDSKENAGETFSKYNQFSLEARLINYILTNLNRKHKSDTLWIERMYESEYVKKAIKDRDIYDTLLFYLPTFIKSVKGSVRYKKYEEGIELCVRALADLTPEKQFVVLKTNPNLQKFWDLLKTRCHLPTALGVYFMRAIRSANYKRKEIREIVENPNQTKIYVPEKFRIILFKYINYLMSLFIEDNTI
jgi:hypothetical protein